MRVAMNTHPTNSMACYSKYSRNKFGMPAASVKNLLQAVFYLHKLVIIGTQTRDIVIPNLFRDLKNSFLTSLLTFPFLGRWDVLNKSAMTLVVGRPSPKNDEEHHD